MKRLFVLMLLILSQSIFAQKNRQELLQLLGKMPIAPKLKIDTLEVQKLAEGYRYKIKFLSEDANEKFHTPKDFIEAYLFVPFHKKGDQLPAIVAVHQDGPHNYLGKLETAGIQGDAEQFYGLELFKRGYIVICPDRFYHGIRRRIKDPSIMEDTDKDMLSLDHWAGQLLSDGRTSMGKEAYDLQRSVDVLYSLPEVDRKNIGAMGHSAGGNVLPYFMLLDTRVKVGASSCGVFELTDWYNEDANMKRYAFSVIPNFNNSARTSDFLGNLAPRPFLMTRGVNEWGDENDKRKQMSLDHVKSTEKLTVEAMKYYEKAHVQKNLQTIYFSDGKGYHAIPSAVKKQIFDWLDKNLK